MKQSIGKIMLIFSLLCVVFAVILGVRAALGSTLFHFNYSNTWAMLLLFFMGLSLLEFYRIIDLLEFKK